MIFTYMYTYMIICLERCALQCKATALVSGLSISCIAAMCACKVREVCSLFTVQCEKCVKSV